MAEVFLVTEDAGMESFVRALVERIAIEEELPMSLTAIAARGGAGRAKAEFVVLQDVLVKGMYPGTSPDFIIVGIDANGAGWHARRNEVLAAVAPEWNGRVVVVCPDPHLERWIFTDSAAFRSVVGVGPPGPPTGTGKDRWKNLLSQTLANAGVTTLVDEYDIVPDLVDELDLHRAGRSEASLRAAIADVRGALRLA